MAAATGAVAMNGAGIIPTKDTETGVGGLGTEDILTQVTEVIQGRDGIPDGAGITTMTMGVGSITEAGSAAATTTRQFPPDGAAPARYGNHAGA